MSGDQRMPELTVGLIGCGSIAQSAHVPALLRLSALVRVLNVCDIRPAVAEQVAHTLGATWTSDYHQLLEDPRIDAVVITTPEFLHAEQAIAAPTPPDPDRGARHRRRVVGRGHRGSGRGRRQCGGCQSAALRPPHPAPAGGGDA